MLEKEKTRKGVIVSKVSDNGQISLPLCFRRDLGIKDYVTVYVEKGKIILEKLEV